MAQSLGETVDFGQIAFIHYSKYSFVRVSYCVSAPTQFCVLYREEKQDVIAREARKWIEKAVEPKMMLSSRSKDK